MFFLLGKQVGRSVIALLTLLAIGVIGYIAIEGWSLLDASYMTILTFTTVGYDEVRPLSATGRVFTMLLMVGGVGVMLYFLTAVMKNIIEEEVFRSFVRRRRMKTRLAGEHDHFILCGFGRVGREVAVAFQQEGVHFIVVDSNTHAISEASEMDFPYIQGDATADSTLHNAGINRARGLVAATGDDSHNVFITLSARGLNPDLMIVARTTNPENEEKLKRAGANKVISPFSIGGRRMAMSVVRPLAVDFVDSMFNSTGKRDLRLTEIQVAENSGLAGATISRWGSPKEIEVVALKRQSGEMVVSPKGSIVVQPGDSLFIVGPSTQLESLEGKA